MENLDTSKLELSVILNDRVATDNGHLFSFSIAVNTSKYLYTINDAIISKRVLTPTALKHSIEDHLSTLSEWNVNATPSSAVNQVLYVINDTAFNLYNNHSNTIG